MCDLKNGCFIAAAGSRNEQDAPVLLPKVSRNWAEIFDYRWPLTRPRFTPAAGMVRDNSEKAVDLERLCQVVVATAGEDLLPVARHGKGGDCDHRNGSRLLVSLQPPSCVHPRYVR